MSEFNRLMQGGFRRENIKKRQASRKNVRLALAWSLGISFGLMLAAPLMGTLVFITTLIIACIYASREWMG